MSRRYPNAATAKVATATAASSGASTSTTPASSTITNWSAIAGSTNATAQTAGPRSKPKKKTIQRPLSAAVAPVLTKSRTKIVDPIYKS